MPTLAERAKAHPDNFGARRGTKVDLVIVHVTEGSAKSALAWFADARAKSSAHYLVTKAGVVWEIVHEDDCAWHAGNVEYNRRSVGIECEGLCDRPDTFTPAMIEALVRLVGAVCDRHGIPRDREHVIGHNEVPNPKDPSKKGGANGHTDPGPHFPWALFMEWLTDPVRGVA